MVSEKTLNGQGPTCLSQSVVNDIQVLKMVVRKEVELVEEIPDVYATEGIHLRERQDAWKPAWLLVRDPECMNNCTHVSSSVGLSGVNQLTLSTFSYSCREFIAIGM
jgi:hypothetical protein